MLSKMLIVGVRAYQLVLGAHMGNCCRFEPSCSHYSIEALRVHGAWRGLWLTGCRVLRCHPFGPSGYDPVPPKQVDRLKVVRRRERKRQHVEQGRPKVEGRLTAFRLPPKQLFETVEQPNCKNLPYESQ